jgi:serine/threonine protein kinase HipA of HipAB toxin-antitoxin module
MSACGQLFNVWKWRSADRYIDAPVINVFDNLLPDSDAIRRPVAERVGAGSTDAHSLSNAEPLDCALARIAIEDDFGARLVRRKGRIAQHIDLEC